jgi:hypothetical protein
VKPATKRLGWLAVVWLAAAPLHANAVLEWNALMMQAIRVSNTAPTLSTRNLAILHLALYDALAAIEGTHQPYRLQPPAPPGASTLAAVAAAGREVMRALYPSFEARTEELYLFQERDFPPGATGPDGVAVGLTAARGILAERGADGSSTQVPYIPSNEPGQWRRTPPFYRPPLDPHWRYVKLFAIPEIEPFVPPPPPALTSEEYARDFNQVKILGERNSPVRTAEQSLIAVFWSDFSYTAMPPGHWHEIAATIAAQSGLSLPETTRLFALLSLAQADASIVCWETKYRYNFWRPVTAIQRADEDGNPDTVADPAWDHYLVAPNFPEYTSGHSTFSKASAEVLTWFLGTDAVTFTATSDSLPGVTRTFHSLAACADEVGMSRIYGGIHFEFANREGKRSGAKVAHYVVANYLLPNAALPLVHLEQVAPGGTRLRLHGHVGRSCVLEASSDLRAWAPVSTNLAVAGGCVVEDVPAAPARFYRVVEF